MNYTFSFSTGSAGPLPVAVTFIITARISGLLDITPSNTTFVQVDGLSSGSVAVAVVITKDAAAMSLDVLNGANRMLTDPAFSSALASVLLMPNLTLSQPVLVAGQVLYEEPCAINFFSNTSTDLCDPCPPGTGTNNLPGQYACTPLHPGEAVAHLVDVSTSTVFVTTVPLSGLQPGSANWTAVRDYYATLAGLSQTDSGFELFNSTFIFSGSNSNSTAASRRLMASSMPTAELPFSVFNRASIIDAPAFGSSPLGSQFGTFSASAGELAPHGSAPQAAPYYALLTEVPDDKLGARRKLAQSAGRNSLVLTFRVQAVGTDASDALCAAVMAVSPVDLPISVQLLIPSKPVTTVLAQTATFKCKAGTFLNTSMQCEHCLPGTFSSDGQSGKCASCPPGSFATKDHKSCSFCPPLSDSTSGAADISVCKCKFGYYPLYNSSGIFTCTVCPKNAICDNVNIDRPTATEGWWHEPGDISMFYDCQQGYCLPETKEMCYAEDAHPDGFGYLNGSRIQNCRLGHKGMVCMECWPNWAVQGSYCVECPPTTKTYDTWTVQQLVSMFFFISVVVVAILTGFFLSPLFFGDELMKENEKKRKEEEKRKKLLMKQNKSFKRAYLEPKPEQPKGFARLLSWAGGEKTEPAKRSRAADKLLKPGNGPLRLDLFGQPQKASEGKKPLMERRSMKRLAKRVEWLTAVYAYGAAVPLRLVLETLQIIASFKRTVQVAFPPQTQTLFNSLGVLEMNVFSAPGAACQTPKVGFIPTFLSLIGLVSFFLGYLCLMWHVGIRIMRMRKWDETHITSFNRLTIQRYVMITTFSYAPLAEKVLNVFVCRKIGATSYLRADARITCEGPGYLMYWRLAFVCVGVFIIGIPLSYIFLLRYYNVARVSRDGCEDSKLRAICDLAQRQQLVGLPGGPSCYTSCTTITDEHLDILYKAYIVGDKEEEAKPIWSQDAGGHGGGHGGNDGGGHGGRAEAHGGASHGRAPALHEVKSAEQLSLIATANSHPLRGKIPARRWLLGSRTARLSSPISRAIKLEAVISFSELTVPSAIMTWSYVEGDERMVGARESIGKLFLDFNMNAWYWSVVETCNKLILSGVLPFITPNTFSQLMVGAALTFSMLMHYVNVAPYADATYRACGMSMVMILFLFFFTVCFMKAGIIFNLGPVDMYAYICNSLSSSLFVVPGLLVINRLRFPIDAEKERLKEEEEKRLAEEEEKEREEEEAEEEEEEEEPEADVRKTKYVEDRDDGDARAPSTAAAPAWAAEWDSVPLRKKSS